MHIRKSFWNLRSVTMFIIFFFVTDMFLRPLRSYAQTVNEATGPAMLAFLFCSNYFLKMIMLSIIYYYSNVPFMEKDRQYYFLRLGRTRFCLHNLFYIMASGIILSLLLWLISFLDMASCIKFHNTWSKISRTLALTDAGDRILLHFSVPYQPLENFTPLKLCLYSLSITALCFMTIGIMMYALCLCFHKTVAVFTAGIVVMLPDIMKRATMYPFYFSPVSWMGCDTWRYGYDVTKPDIAYIFVGYFFLIFLFGTICIWRIRKTEYLFS